MSGKGRLPWGDSPYDTKTPAEVVHDYAVVRGDLSEQYARDQLSEWIKRYAAEAWRLGHEASRDYQGDGWNSDAHDPERDNPYRSEATSADLSAERIENAPGVGQDDESVSVARDGDGE